MIDEKKRTVLLGLLFLLFLILSFVENTLFFGISNIVLENQLLSIGVIFLHNLIVISLILLGMTFYVRLVLLKVFKGQKYEYTVLEHPKIFAVTFTIIILFLSILRASILFFGGMNLQLLPLILLGSAPVGIVEGYGVYLTINKTLSRTMSMKGLIHIYIVFLVAAVLEVAFMNLLR